MNSQNPLGGNPLGDPLSGLVIHKPAPKKEPVEE